MKIWIYEFSSIPTGFLCAYFLKDRLFRGFRFYKFLIPKCFDAKKRPNKVILRPYLQISFCTEFEALSDGIHHVCIYSVKYGQIVQKSNFHFLRFIHCSTSKHKTKQTPFDSPFYFVSTFLELIDSKVKATLLMFKKFVFEFSAKGFTRHSGQKNDIFKKNENLPNSLHIISDVFAIILAQKHASENDFFM